MGQKTNPNVFKIDKKNNWKFKYFEKKITENSISLKKNIEIWNFMNKFFKNHCMLVNNCKLLYLNRVFQIYLSYYCNLDFFFLKKKSSIQIKKLKNKIIINTFLNKLFISLTKFFWKKLNFFLVTKKLKNNLKKTINQKIKKLLQKKITNFRKFKQTAFFEDGINILVTCIINNKTSKLLAKFLSNIIKKIRHHNFFIKFIWNVLKILIISSISKIKGIKINIKGRLNGRPRAITKNLKFNKNVSLINSNYKISYFEEIAYSLNGTISVKVWINNGFL